MSDPREVYKAGNWNSICDSCGFKFKATELKKRWDGFMVCKEDWELRNPQDLLKGRKERITPAWTRPQGTDQFVTGVTYQSATSTVPAGTFNTTDPIGS